MQMYNLIEYSDTYLKTGRLWQYYRHDPNDNVTQSESFKYKMKITEELLKWRTLEMLLINREINLILTWSEDCTDTKLYDPVVTNAKLLQQLKSGFKRRINWNRYQLKVSPERQNQYLDFLIDPSFQGVNKIFYSIV